MSALPDWDTYRRQCDEPDVMSRHLLLRTAELLGESRLARRVADLTLAPPLAVPPAHKRDARADMFRVSLSRADAQRVLAEVERNHRDGEVHFGYLAVWREYCTARSGS